MTEQTELHILMTRVDNRLVHGQVGVTWTKTLGANLIIVADDIVANDILQQKLMEATAHSSGAQIRFFSLAYTAEIIHQASSQQKIYIVVRNMQSVSTLVKLGVPIENLNIGNLHFERGKHMVNKKVYVNEQDLEDFKYLFTQNMHIFIQDVPGDPTIKIQKVEDLMP